MTCHGCRFHNYVRLCSSSFLIRFVPRSEVTMAHNLQFKTNPVSTFQDKKEKQVGKTSKAKGKKAKNADAEAEALLDAFGENEEDGDEVQKEADTTDAAEAVPPSQTGDDDAQDMMAAGIEFLRFKNQQISRDVKAGTHSFHHQPSSAQLIVFSLAVWRRYSLPRAGCRKNERSWGLTAVIFHVAFAEAAKRAVVNPSAMIAYGIYGEVIHAVDGPFEHTLPQSSIFQLEFVAHKECIQCVYALLRETWSSHLWQWMWLSQTAAGFLERDRWGLRGASTGESRGSSSCLGIQRRHWLSSDGLGVVSGFGSPKCTQMLKITL